MLFPSAVFLYYFLPALVVLYFVTPAKLKNLVLLCASLVFYAWGEAFYVLVLMASILMNYVVGLLICRQEDQKRNVSIHDIEQTQH